MRFLRWTGGAFAFLIVALLQIVVLGAAAAQPAPGVACVVTAGNRNAPLAADGTYTIFGIPGDLGVVRARATCSDGSFGQSGIQFTNPNEEAVLELGPIEFGRLDPVPAAVQLSAPTSRLTTGQTAQLQLLAVGADGQQWDATLRSAGTTYYLSNRLLASVTDDGLVTAHPLFAPGSSARVLAGATAEGAVTSTMMFTLGPRGRLAGRVVRADGVTPVGSAQVSVIRLQPMEAAGTATTDAAGVFQLEEVYAGSFLVSAVDPVTGDRAQAFARIEHEGETAQVDLRMNGLATVNVTVVDGDDQATLGAVVTYTALGVHRTVRSLQSGADGAVSFAGVPAGDFTVSTRDPTTRLIGAAAARIEPGQRLDLVLRLQRVGQIEGRVLDIDGVTPVVGVQVRVASRERGILTQSISAEDGGFGFDSLPLSDGPYTLDAFVSGRLRSRVPGVVLSQPNQTVQRDIVFGAIGTVGGRVRNPSGIGQPNARVVLQSLEGLNLRFERDADAQGLFEFSAVPVGAFELTAVTAEGRTGRSAGAISANGEQIQRDVVVTEDTLVGRVFQRDGVTPVGAGVQVYLSPRSVGLLYTLAGHPESVSTQTDADGRYGFTVPDANTWVVQAEQDLERGRTELVVVNLNPSQPLVADLVFLAKGSVSGTVHDAGGVAQPNVPVSVRTQGAFVAERLTQTDAQGRYALDGVFAGSVSAFASNPQTRLSGVSQGRLDAEGQAIVLDVSLAPTGTIQGQVLLRQGGAVPDAVRVTMWRNGSQLQTLELPTGLHYRFENAPLGNIHIEVERLGNGDRGLATTRLNAAGEVKVLPVRLVGQAAIEVNLIDAGGSPVEGARVVLSQSAPFPLMLERQSDGQGRVRFDHVHAGDFSITASKPALVGRLSGSTSGTLLPGQDQQFQIVMQALAYGRIRGTVHEPDGLTPVGAGKFVRMLPEPFPNAFVTVTDENGQYAFDPVDAGSYTIDVLNFFVPGSGACPNRDRIRGRATGVTLSEQGEEVVANVQLIGQGRVGGVVLDGQEQPVADIRIRLNNPDPVYGANVACNGRTTFETSTNASGQYLLPDVPPGDFTMTAENGAWTMRAEGRGRVRFDGDQVTLDLVVVDSAITMPRSFFDANGFRFDIQGTGSVGTGTNNVFEGSGPDTAGMRLELIQNGIPMPFLNGDGSIGRLDVDGQQVELKETSPSGLLVTRRVRTPRAGYFSRYLEILENPTAEPITVSVRVRSNHRSAQSTPRVVDTSDGDQVLSVSDPQNPDRWAVIDDQLDADPFTDPSSIPVTGHLFDGAGGGVSVGLASYELIGMAGRLTYQWNEVTVPSGSRVILMHFAFNQIDREAAREAALRLALLPPEAIEDLTTDERADVRNFAVTEQSSLPPLPNLDAGELTGNVFSGDGVTPVPGARVRFKSLHPLFGRLRFVNAAADGSFQYRSTLTGMADNYVIPGYAFELSATYLRSRAQSALALGDFESGLTSAVQNLLFTNAGDVSGVVKRHNNAVVADARVNLCRVNDPDTCMNVAPNPDNYAQSGVDGRYHLLASVARDYYLFASKPHPQGSRPMLGEATVAVTAGDLVIADITMEQTGSITGTVRAPDGTPLVNARVDLYLNRSTEIARTATTDTAGLYRLFDVPLGTHRLRARDAISGSEGGVEPTVAVDIETQADITLSGFGALRVQVQFARGLAAGNARVEAGESSSQATNSSGLATFQLPQGSYQIRAYHPDNASLVLTGQSAATIESLGQQVEALVVLQPAGAVLGTIVRPDGTTLAGGFPYAVRQIRGGDAAWPSRKTDDTGSYRVAGLPLGAYVITAYDPVQDRYADSEFVVSEDGQEVQVDLVLQESRIPLPATMRDANRFAFDVQRSGALALGDSAFHNGGVALEVNGQPFTGEPSARLEADRRQLAVEQPGGIDGLLVTRRVYVPRGAYFARYIETLENPTSAPILATVRLSTRFAGGAVLTTSSGDTVVNTDDRWVIVDDGVDADIREYQGQPATVLLWGHAHAGARAPSSVAWDALEDRPRLRQTWQDLIVPPGEQVSLVHFVVQQVNRDGALVAAARLAEIPPEVLPDLPPGVLASSLNFVLPVDGQSEMEALPSLTASVQGVALEGDTRTPVRSAHITVQSTHPLFNRVWGKRVGGGSGCGPGTVVQSLVSLQTPGGVTDPRPEGSYALQGQLTAEDSIALPEGVAVRVVAQEDLPCYGAYAGHPLTHYPSRAENVVPSVQHDVIWDTGLLTGTVVGSSDFSVTGGRLYRSIDDPDPPSRVHVPIATDGTYLYPGLPPGQYELLFDTQHPQGSGSQGGLLRGQRTNVEVTLGAITVTDVSMQPTGRLQGTLVRATGEPARDAQMSLEGMADGQVYDQCASNCGEATLTKHKGKRQVRREVITDSLGRYDFNAVPAGSYTLTAIDPVSEGRVTVAVEISADQIGVRNVTLLALGSVELQVRKQSGTPAVDAVVYLNAASAGGERVAGRTSATGRLTVANIPQGDYTLRIRDPRHPIEQMDNSVSGSIVVGGQVDTHEVELFAAATLRVQVVHSDNGGQPVADARVWVRDAHSERFIGFTNAQGQINAAPVLAGGYTVRASAWVNGLAQEDQVSGSLTAANDEQLIPVLVDLPSSVVPLPFTLADANQQPYSVSADGGAARMPRLRINQEDFAGNSTATWQLGGRQLRIEQAAPIVGLHVSRRVFTARNGYFARYVEVLENRSSSSITVDVSVHTRSAPVQDILMTSSGDNVLGSNGPDADRWFTIGSIPTASARGFVFSSPEGGLLAPVLNYSPWVGNSDRTVSATWNDVTVPPGERVLLMHFMIEQLNPAAALAAAERLYLLPPEAIEGLAGGDALDVSNFGVPEDGMSAIESLPSLEGVVAGRVLEGDAATPVASTNVTLRSLHPLFPRQWTRTSNPSGDYAWTGSLQDGSPIVAVPVGSRVEVSAQHPRTGMVWTGNADFGPGQSMAVQDIVFDSGSVFGQIIGAFEAAVNGGTVTAFRGATQASSANVSSGGRYSLGGLESGTYRLVANVNLMGASGSLISGEVAGIVVSVGQGVEQDIALQPNGSLTGRVFSFEGHPRSNLLVELRRSSGGFLRTANTNALGRYTFAGVPVGTYTVTSTEQATLSSAAAPVEIAANQQVEQDLVLGATRTINVTVLGEDNQPVGAGVQVSFRPRNAPWFNLITSWAGQVSHRHDSNSPLAVRARHPTLASVFDEAEVSPEDGAIVNLTLAPRPASLTGRVLDADGQPLANHAISVLLRRNDEYLTGFTTNSEGRFAFPVVSGGVALWLRSIDPHNGVVNRAEVMVPRGETVNQDVVLLGRGTVAGQVRNAEGVPLIGVQVEARYVVDELSAFPSSSALSIQTDANGNYRIEQLPTGRELDLQVSLWLGGTQVSQSQTVQLDSHGQTLISDIVFDVPGGSLHVQVLGSDGLPADGSCEASYYPSGGGGEARPLGSGSGQYQSGPCSEGLRFNGVPPGEVLVSGYANEHGLYLDERAVDIVDDELSEVIYRFGVVSGAVSFPGGEPAEDASVRLIQDSAMQYASTRTGGSYRVLGAQVGELVVEAEDNISGLTASSVGEVLSEDVPVTVNVVLPESGLIEGELRDHAGSVVANALVYARSSGRDLERSTYTDAQGRFAFDRIAFGNVRLVAVHPDSGLVASGQAQVDQPDQVVSVQLNFEQPASLTGIVLRPDGLPAAFVCVSVISTEEGLGYGEFQRSAQTSATGEFSFNALILGHVEVHASSCTSSSASAIESVELHSGQSSRVDMQIGSARRTGDIVLSEGVSGYTLRAQSPSGWWARRPDNNWHTAYDQTYRMGVNGVYFPWRQSGRLLNDARTVEFSSQAMSGVRVQRRIDVPPASGYARLLDTFANTGPQSVEISVRYSGRMTQWGDVWSVMPDVTAGRYFISSPEQISGTYVSGHAAHVVGGIAGVVPEVFDVQTGQIEFSWSWTLQLAPGEVAHLLQYSVPRLPALFSEAEAQAQALSNMTEPNMFDGLSESERAGIRNFQVPAQ